MKPTRRGFLTAALMAPIAAAVSKWHTPKPLNEWKTVEPIFEWTPEIRPLYKEEFTEFLEEVYHQKPTPFEVPFRETWTSAREPRPLFWREKILKEYPNRPSDLMTILGKLRKP